MRGFDQLLHLNYHLLHQKRQYTDQINRNIEYWEKEYGFNDDKAIPIPTNQHNLILVFNRTEFEEFKKLLNLKDTFNHNSLSYKDLENDFCLN